MDLQWFGVGTSEKSIGDSYSVQHHLWWFLPHKENLRLNDHGLWVNDDTMKLRLFSGHALLTMENDHDIDSFFNNENARDMTLTISINCN